MGVTPTSLATRQLALGDIAQVVRIHREQFPAARSTLLGDGFLRAMYRWFLVHQPNLSIVVVDGQDVVGFVVGAVGGYGRRIARATMPQILAALIFHPSLLLQRATFRQWKSLSLGFVRPVSPPKSSPLTRKASIASIAVAERYKGRGAGRAVMRAFEESALRSGVDTMGLSVHLDNVPAARLYENSGWQRRDSAADSQSAYYFKVLSQQSTDVPSS